jgi:hypothetical protein
VYRKLESTFRYTQGEIWSFVGEKQARIQPGDNRARLGDQWTFVALDPDTKLVPAYRVGKQTKDEATAFMNDLSQRLSPSWASTLPSGVRQTTTPPDSPSSASR